MLSFYKKIFFISFVISFGCLADFDVLDKKINKLIEQIRNSKATFIRGDVEYNCEKAADHISRKYTFAKMSPLTPSKKDWTFAFFVNEIASKSSSTGEDYYIRVKDKKMKMKNWIEKQNLSD